jgi:hypothetical protein
MANSCFAASMVILIGTWANAVHVKMSAETSQQCILTNNFVSVLVMRA